MFVMVLFFFIFILAGLCEIGGGYLIWLWLREGQPSWLGVIGGILILYGDSNTTNISDIWKSICCIRGRIHRYEFSLVYAY